jgi:glycosyltransferase involved in cell wall biosynthesis
MHSHALNSPMASFTTHNFPFSPEHRKGWPWSFVDSKPQAGFFSEDSLPSISIVTPSYNQGKFIEETIRSILLQGYPNLEYIIIDGGSSDNTIEIIKKYEPWLKYWVSEPDRGQSHAINKGFEHANGDLFAWLNSDDYYFPNALYKLIELRIKHPSAVAWVGACRDVDIKGNRLKKRSPRVGSKKDFGNWSKSAWIPQPSCLFDAKTFFDAGKLDETLHFVMDVDLWMRMAERGIFVSFDELISYARMYPSIKTRRNIPMQQAEHILVNFKQGLPEIASTRMANCMELALDAWSYRKLLRYFLRRTRLWLWHSFLWLCGK